MEQEDIKRIEQKVDLLYRMHLDDNINFRNNLDELIPLFNLSVEIDDKIEKMRGLITVKVKELFEKGEEIENKLNKLKSDYKAGNFLAKEEEKTKTLIYNQEEKYKALIQIGKDYRSVKWSEEALREELLMINLKEKVGIELEEDEKENEWTTPKERLEEELKGAIEWLQERIKEYKKKFK